MKTINVTDELYEHLSLCAKEDEWSIEDYIWHLIELRDELYS